MSMALLDWAESEMLDFDLSGFLLSSRFACLYKARPLYYSLSFIDIIYIIQSAAILQRECRGNQATGAQNIAEYNCCAVRLSF